ncbi:MAG: RNA polymerase sigma factor [Bacteroidales bacterium]|jgi:RNA polymerase sigma-70 factor (ECF subfamily)|nr:RNA polymerase sigma factor [Bacteroidales bacterium]
MEDLLIAQKIADGDKEVFENFYNEYSLKLLNLCYGMLHNKTDAEDLVQEIFIEIYNNAQFFKGKSKLSTWVYRIAINKTISHIRKKKIRNIFVPIENEARIGQMEQDHESEQTQQEEKLKYLQSAIDTLPAKQKTAIVLFAYEQMPQKEIAEVMKCSLSAVEVMIHRAKKTLKQKLEIKYNEIENL